VFPAGDVAVVDRKNSIGYLRADAANKFRVQWGATPAGELAPFPTYDQNCTSGCRPNADRGGTCLCDITVEQSAVVLADPSADATLPTEAELRATLTIGASDPAAFGSDYTVCTTNQCTSIPNIRVHTLGTSATPTEFGTDTIFEFTKDPPVSRPSARR
jgi:hypothetical protein